MWLTVGAEVVIAVSEYRVDECAWVWEVYVEEGGGGVVSGRVVDTRDTMERREELDADRRRYERRNSPSSSSSWKYTHVTFISWIISLSLI